MSMHKDIESQINRAKELLQDLEVSCNSDLQKKVVSEKTKNLCPEVLLKIRRLLDQVTNNFFEKYYYENLSDSQKKRIKIYFPMVSKKEDLKSQLGRMGMQDLETRYPDFYKYIESIQPYNEGYVWVEYLNKFSNESHVKLTPQVIQEKNETHLGSAVRVGAGGSVAMRGCIINGIPVNSNDINNEPLENFDPRLNAKRITWASFVFSGTNINILELSKKSVEEGEKITKKIFEFCN